MLKNLLNKLREARKRKKADILFICDGKACKTCNPSLCRHTTDPAHAVNFCFEYGKAYIEQ